MRILVDTNILMDYISQRQPFCISAEKIMEACVEGKIEGYIAAHTVPNLFYILRKQYSIEERRELLINLCEIFSISGIGNEIIVNALNDKGFDDFEYCLQEKCAISSRVDYLVTRNIKDFGNSAIKCIDSDEFVQVVLENSKESKN